jgi:hypothetical protein
VTATESVANAAATASALATLQGEVDATETVANAAATASALATLQGEVDATEVVANAAATASALATLQGEVDATEVVANAAQPAALVDAGGLIDATTVTLALQEAFKSEFDTAVHTSPGSTLTLTDFPGQKVVMNADLTLTFPSPTTEGKSFVLRLEGAFAVTWPASVDWADNSPPTYATSARFTFYTDDGGTNWTGVYLGGAFA